MSQNIEVTPAFQETKTCQIQQGRQNIQSHVWSGIPMNKPKEVREIIEISEEKSNSTHESHPLNQNLHISSIQRNQMNNQKIIIDGRILQQEVLNKMKPVESVQSLIHHQMNIQQNKQPQKQLTPQQQKDLWQYTSSKQLFQNGQINIEIIKEFKQSQQIFLTKKEQLFQGTLNQNKTYFEKVQKQTLDWLFSKFLKKDNNDLNQNQKKLRSCNIVRLIDLLYKKYIVSPVKSSVQTDRSNSQSHYDIYKPDLIYCERKYSLIDNSIQSQTPSSFKRNAPQKNYNDNFVSLVDNQSNHQNQDYLQVRAANFINGIRRQANSNQFQMQKPSVTPSLDKFKKYGNPNPEISLPFDIDMYEIGSKRQMSSQYNLFQSSDDDKSERFKQQKQVAKTFIKDGYGLQIIRNYMGPSMDGGTYNRAITTIIRESYKKIEDFLTKTCNMKIHCLTSQQFSLVKTPLVHCRNILKSEDLNTFFKFIGITYNFNKLRKEDYPTAQETLSLYNAILRGLSDRKTAKDHMPKISRERDLYYR